jgi:hypothetical protein
MPIVETPATAALAYADRKQIPEAELFRGTLIWKHEPEYDEARIGRVFNARKPERFPAAILFAECVADVVAAVKLAERHHLRISIRSGGHSWDAWSVRNGALLIDLGRMREMSYDPGTNTAVVSPAVSGGELNPFLHEFGVFFAGGHCPDVGLGGFLLQGGMGWNTRGWGWACERIDGIDVVLPDGREIHASTHENPDIFWAARGSGPGFFGIVVRFFLKPRPQPKELTRTTFVFPMEAYDEVMPWLQRIHSKLDPSIEIVAIGLQVPVPDSAEATHRHSLVVHALSFADTREDACAALAPLAGCPAQGRAFVCDLCVPTTLQAEYEEQRRQNPGGNRYAADNAYLSGSAEQVIPLLKPCFETLPTTRTFALWYSMAPLTKLSDMALSLQSELYFAIYTVWESPQDDARCRNWLHQQMLRIQPFSDGYYLGDCDIPARSAKFMEDDHFARLQKLRRLYDPMGRLCSYREHASDALNVNSWKRGSKPAV